MTRNPSFFDSAQHLNDDGVNLYVDALKLERRKDLPREVRAHVSDCPECKRKILDLCNALGDIPYAKDQEHPFFDQSRSDAGSTFVTYLRMAAGVFLLLGVSAVAAYLWLRHPAATETASSLQSISADSSGHVTPQVPAQSETYARNYVESPNLQGLVGRSFRSGDIKILAPAVGEVMHDSLAFGWDTQAPPPFVLRIVNNREDSVLTRSLGDSHFVLRQKLEPGLYYWKLESRDQLLYVGKFFVK